MKRPWSLGLLFSLSLAACGDANTSTGSDAGAADVTTPQDRGTALDVADVPATDAPATDAPATDAPATDVPATDVPVTVADAGVDVPADRGAAVDAPTDNGEQPGRVCGGRGGSPCPDGQFCDFPISSICGAADGPGVCTTPPEVCNDLYDPVCGCDGRTYSNACDAAANRASVSRRGACDAKADAGAGDAAVSDCRTDGCSSTSSCMACRGVGGLVYACIPNGAAC
jgi:hypothetical protein